MTVNYWTSSGTHDYVREFIDDQLPKIKKKIIRDLEMIERLGSSANMKKLKGYKLHEIKIKSCRIFCAIRGSICWLLHGFNKKSNQTPVREIATAVTRMNELDLFLALHVS